MSVLDRLKADTGAPYPAWLYLADKAAHTAGITLLVMSTGVTVLPASIVATLAYVVLGKLWFLWRSWERAQVARTRAFQPRFLDDAMRPVLLGAEVRDSIFDTLMGGLVVAVALLITKGLTIGAAVLGTLIVTIAILLNAHWGSPPG